MGGHCAVSEEVPCPGLRWRVPDTVPAPSGGDFYASLWDYTAGVRVRHQVITPVAGGDQDFLWDAGPVTLDAAKEYVCQIWTRIYSFRSAGGGFPVTSPNGILSMSIGKLTDDDPDTLAASQFESYYYVSPLIGTVEEETAELSGTLAMPALDLSAVLVPASVLSGTLAMPALDLSAVLVPASVLSGSLAMPALDVSGVIFMDVPETSSPNVSITSYSRGTSISTISREAVISTGARGGQ
jgi:hypothetical protein